MSAQPQVEEEATHINIAPVAAWPTDIHMASGDSTDHARCRTSARPSVVTWATDINIARDCSRTIDPDMALSCSMRPRHHQGLRWQHRPLRSVTAPASSVTHGHRHEFRKQQRPQTSNMAFADISLRRQTRTQTPARVVPQILSWPQVAAQATHICMALAGNKCHRTDRSPRPGGTLMVMGGHGAYWLSWMLRSCASLSSFPTPTTPSPSGAGP